MQTLATQMSFYSRYHQKAVTKITHFIGVPLVIFAFMILLSWIDAGISGWLHINFSWLALIGLLIYYFALDKELAAATGVALIILNIIAQFFARGVPNWLGLKAFLITLVLGVFLQIIGHFLEGKKPALLDNLFQVFIAPIFLTAEVAFMLGKKQKLKEEIDTLNSNNL